MERDALSVLEIVVGILAAVVGGALAVINFHRSRSRLRVKSLTAVLADNSQHVQITVVNIGARDVTLDACGFAVFPISESRLPWVRRRQRKAAKRWSELGVSIEDDGTHREETVLLKPSERLVIEVSMSFVAGWVSPESQAWPWTQDTRGVDTYADQAAHVEFEKPNYPSGAKENIGEHARPEA